MGSKADFTDGHTHEQERARYQGNKRDRRAREGGGGLDAVSSRPLK